MPTLSTTLSSHAVRLIVTAALVVNVYQAAVASAVDSEFRATIDEETTLTTPQSEDEFPSVGYDCQGRLWVAWVSYDGVQDQLLARRQGTEDWTEPHRLSNGPGDHWKPATGREAGQRFWVVWSQNDNGNWDIWGRYLENETWSLARRLTQNQANDFGQKLVTDSQGHLWMAWQAVVESNYEIMLGRVTIDGLTNVQNVSEHSANDWEPALAAGNDGRVVVAWDSYRGGSYDILIRERQSGELGPILPVAASPDYEAHSAVAVDQNDRVWVAWDIGGSQWGQHGQARERLHEQRRVGLCCVDQGQQFQPVGWSDVFQGELAQFCELPELTVDGKGRLWLFVRHLHDVTPPGTRPNGRRNQPRGIWNFYALCYADHQWSQPLVLPNSSGRNDMRISTCLDDAGQVHAAWADDGRRIDRAEEPINHNVHVARLTLAEDAPRGVQPADQISQIEAPQQVVNPKPVPYTITSGNMKYRLLFGDTHRHTDISRCSMNYDGSLMDTYRYAIDAAQLDFLAISDHDQDLLKHRYDKKQSPLLGYAWWRSQKYCDLFYMAERFLPIYGYEHGGSLQARGGHKNVLYENRGMPCLEVDSPDEMFALLKDKSAVVIPHQLADGASATDWSRWSGDFERVAEIFQTRGSYEYFGAPRQATVSRKGHYLWDALDKGVRIGVIASSDHGMVHGAYAGVYAESFTRRGVLQALRDRRSFGATERIVLNVQLDGHPLGQHVDVSGHPTFEVTVKAAAPIQQVQLVKNGKFIYTVQPKEKDVQLRYTDSELSSGESAYYYLRVQQENNEWAWSSAIWANHQRSR